ncbi:TcaA NTF2-like domain-containing protein [Kurthia huakuii]|uniref:TcaA NTF2-like domain-containing protein n=1 Tax=Kurthia huakuii TaxID=1421019 RepID=UPI000495693B|nr:hypothetical protein [Kurthia huakuii]MBM7697848.1 hypothetical protein [Kurthia huakuii]
MNKKFKWLMSSSALVLMLAGCSQHESEKKTEVSTQAQKTFLFFDQQSTNDDGENVGDLYIHTMGNEGKNEKIASDVVDNLFFYNVKKDYVLYLTEDEELYKVSSNESKEKLAEDVYYFDGTSNDNVVLYQDEDANLYSIDLDKKDVEAEKIASEVGQYKLSGKSIYYVSNDSNLTVYNTATREEKTIADEVRDFDFNGEEIFYTDEDNMLFYKENTEKDSTKITGDTVYLSDVTKDKNDIYFISNEDDDSTLNVVDTKDLSVVKKLADDVMDYKVVDGEALYLTEDENLFSKAKDSDTSKKIASDISSFLYSNGELYLSDKDNTLFSKTEDGTKKVASKVIESHITKAGDVIYINDDHELFVNNKKIQSDVQSVSNLDDSVAFATDENKLYFLSSLQEEAKVISDDLDNYSTVNYLNKEIYRNALGFTDIAGYWSYEENGEKGLFEISDDGKFYNMYEDDEIDLEAIEGEASLASFSARDVEAEEDSYEFGTFTLDDDTLTISGSDDEEEITLEKMTKDEAEKSLKTYQQESAAQEKREEAHETALAAEETTSAIETTLENYFDFFEDAMYNGDTSEMSGTVSPSSAFYTSQKQYIENSYDKGTYVEEKGNTITNYTKISDIRYDVAVNENYTIYKSDSSTKEAAYTNVYTMEKFEDGWYITGLK